MPFAPAVTQAHEASAGNSSRGAAAPSRTPIASTLPPAAVLKLRAAARRQALAEPPPVPSHAQAAPLLPSPDESPLRKRVRIVQPVSGSWMAAALPPAQSAGPGFTAVAAKAAPAVPTPADATGASPFLTSALPQSLLTGFATALCNDGTASGPPLRRSSSSAPPEDLGASTLGAWVGPSLGISGRRTAYDPALCDSAPDLLPRRYSSCPSLPGGEPVTASAPTHSAAELAAEPGTFTHPCNLLGFPSPAPPQPLAVTCWAAAGLTDPSDMADGTACGVELSPHPAAPAPHAPDRTFFLRHAEWQVKRVERLAAAASAAAAAAATGGGGAAVPLTQAAAVAAAAAAEGARAESAAVTRAFEAALRIMEFCHGLDRRCAQDVAAWPSGPAPWF
ncbi:hypothetical protein HYH03_011220 [Edaphochlamys debaryana]|uniref:Uncharacterized protein n=1 Tax=Edaphochlamys debaryana TaxID=47281 RepID=A0A835Y0G0_9CHLO|nr:hypothetical protein HYH03_011220 [Edaphochlamys debaryana]|eukprot:KAG2490265.1 hypothetical protein HYH03_011220 [Edaphochlamys debaryana]